MSHDNNPSNIQDNNKYRQFINGLPYAFYSCNTEGYIELYNDAAVDLWGREPDLGKDKWCGAFKLFNSNGKPLTHDESPTALAIKKGQIENNELVIERSDGTKKYVIPHPRLILDKSGKVTGVINTLVDITSQVEAKLKIQESEQRFRNVITQSINPVLLLKGEDLILEVANEPLLKLWNVSTDAIGKPFLKILPEMKEQPFVDILLEVLHSGVPHYGYEQESYIIHPNDRKVIHYFDFVYQPYREGDGRVSEVFVIAIDVTERVMAHKALKEGEMQFSILANNVQNLAWMANADGWIYWYNSRWYEYTGTTPKDMEGWGWQSVHDQEKLPSVLEKWKYSIANGKPFEMIFPLKGADNIYRSFLTRVFPVLDTTGKVSRWVGTNTDIDEHKRFLEKLEKSITEREEQIQTILRYAPDAVITIDKDGMILSWNPQAEFIFGWNENEVIGKTLTETIIPERYREQHIRGISHFLKSGEGPVMNRPIEIFALRKDQSEFPVELKISASKVNNSYMFIGFIRDISVRLKEQEILRNKTIQLVEAQQLAHIGSWEWDIMSNKVEWSDELYRIYKLEPGEFNGDYEYFLYFVHPDDRDHVDALIKNAFNDHKPFNFIHKIICKDGDIRILNSSGKVFTGKEGNVIRMTGTGQDITEQKRYEQELIKSEVRLKDQNHQLERMNKELESFAYVSSHDLQEPLRKIQTFSTRIFEKEERNLTSEGKYYLSRMQDAASRMQQLIEDLLSYSRTSTDELIFEKTDLNGILEEVKYEFKDILEEKHGIIDSNEMCSTNVIPFQIRQLMHNLIGNAIKFSKPSVPPYISVKSIIIKAHVTLGHNLQPGKEYCHISIKDNGIGFESEYSEKIFEVFQRLHNKETYEGTGIGLAIVKKIVDNHNGVIIAKSILNEGASFDIYLPHVNN